MPVPFAVVGCGGGGAVSADDDDEEELERESRYGGEEGKLGCEPAEADWSAKDVSSDARVSAVAVCRSGEGNGRGEVWVWVRVR